MSTISNLSPVTTIAAADNIPLYSASAGVDVRTSLTTLLAWMQANLTFSSGNYAPEYTTQYYAPSATGFTATITDAADGASIHLILTPTAGFAAGTIKLPAAATCIDKQRVMVNCTQQITTLTVDGNGATVTGEPASMAADDFFTLKFDALTTTWYRVA